MIKTSRYLFLIASLLLIWATWQYHNFTNNQLQATKFQGQITKQFEAFNKWKSDIKQVVETESPEDLFENKALINNVNENNFGLFIYKNGIPVFWSDAITKPKYNSGIIGLVELNNGWFFRDFETIGDFKVIWLLEISEGFSFSNQYLKSRFLHTANLPPGVTIVKILRNNCYPVKVSDSFEFYLDFSKAKPEKSFLNAFYVFTFFVWFVAFLVLLYQQWVIISSFNKKWKSGISIIFILILLRLIWLNNPFPINIYLNPLFDPAIYAQSFLFPSLGDLLINAFLILFFSFLASAIINSRSSIVKKYNGAGIWVLLLTINILLVLGINTLLEGLIKNSRIPFNLDHLFELGTFSLVGMLAIGLLFMSYFKLLTALIRIVFNTGLSFYIFVLLAFTVYSIFAALQAGLSNYDLIDTFWTLPLILAIGSWIWFSEHVFYFGVTLLNIAIFAFFTAYVFEKYNAEKEHEIRQVVGERINQIQDPLLELNFSDKIVWLQNNIWLKQIFIDQSVNSEGISALSSLFGEEWFRFKKQVSISDMNKNPLPGSPVLPVIAVDSLSNTTSENLFFYYSSQIGLGYLFSVPIVYQGDSLGYLNGIFSEITEPEKQGFPNLLNDENQAFNNSETYLYARYRNNSRIFSNAEDDFPIYLNQLGWAENVHGFINNNNLNILVLPEKYGYRWMIAKPIPGFLQHLTIFSYLFLFLGLLYALWLIGERLLISPNPLHLSLRSKIQIILVGFIFGILTIYAFIVFAQITEQFNQRNSDQIAEKLNSITVELQHKTGHLDNLDQMSGSELKTYLDKFSEVFYSDISLFNNSGLLAASSSSLIWEKNLLSVRANPTAYAAIALAAKSRFVQEESIGSFHYLSGYKPLYNNAGKKLGILNVPYFARQDNLKNEINRFLLILINVFVLLTGISVIIAVYVSNWITAPLKLMQTSFSSLDLINVNKPINYKGNDEVATMVKVYNQKVKELEDMAEQIAQSERESAWREMAKQVAHEIKNPLTPMRLSIQHFQRLLLENPGKAMERSDSLVNSLIEQIDNLTQIANEFSQFSKISVSTRTIFDLTKQIVDLANLFSGDKNISIITQINIKSTSIQADKGQITRLLNNLIKNAIQAIDQNPDGKIVLSLGLEDRFYKIEVADNGKGIPKALQARIFNPNFTTKSTGMGLGLAIVKKIVSNHNGSITYQTKQNKGTVFTVLLPKSLDT